jgi:hypothetical protein
LSASKSLTEDDIDKIVPKSFREQQRASREKAESISSRLDRLEQNVDEIRVKLFGANATTTITGSALKVEK